MNAPLVSWAYLSSPKSDDRYAQLTRGTFIINDFLQNPHFNAAAQSACGEQYQNSTKKGAIF